MADEQGPIPSENAAEILLSASDDEAKAPPGSLRAALANAMVGLKKRYYGRGPTAAKAWILDEYVFVVMEGGLTRNEETLLADGKGDEVRRYRLSFQATVAPTIISAVEELTHRKVLDYQSQIVFDPPRSFEIFVTDRSD
jgi:uncharacterized protein YbcI